MDNTKDVVHFRFYFFFLFKVEDGVAQFNDTDCSLLH